MINFEGLDNTECDFDIHLLEGPQLSEFTHNAFTLTPSIIEPDNSDIKSVTSYASITIYSTDEDLADKTH